MVRMTILGLSAALCRGLTMTQFTVRQPVLRSGVAAAARYASSRVSTPMMEITTDEKGEFGTTDFVMSFKSGGKGISPWHDIPLEAGGGLYNLLTEIPKMTLKKMEVATKEAGNPIMQDEKKGKARLYHGPIFWNYGCLPQTWEDPNVKGDADVGGAFGDNDPLDVVEIGAASLAMGSITPVKPLGVLSMIDDGELDWKLIAIAASDAHANEINDVGDIEKFYPGARAVPRVARAAHVHTATTRARAAGTVSGIREWFRWYKTPDGKPVNAFGHGEKARARHRPYVGRHVEYLTPDSRIAGARQGGGGARDRGDARVLQESDRRQGGWRQALAQVSRATTSARTVSSRRRARPAARVRLEIYYSARKSRASHTHCRNFPVQQVDT